MARPKGFRAEVGLRLADARVAAGFTRLQLAERVNSASEAQSRLASVATSLSAATVEMIEQGDTNLNATTLRALCLALGVSADHLLGLPAAAPATVS